MIKIQWSRLWAFHNPFEIVALIINANANAIFGISPLNWKLPIISETANYKWKPN